MQVNDKNSGPIDTEENSQKIRAVQFTIKPSNTIIPRNTNNDDENAESIPLNSGGNNSRFTSNNNIPSHLEFSQPMNYHSRSSEILAKTQQHGSNLNIGMKGGRSIIIGGGGRSNSPLLITAQGGHRYKLSTASQGHYRSTGRISPGSSMYKKHSMPARMMQPPINQNNLNNNSNNNSSTHSSKEENIGGSRNDVHFNDSRRRMASQASLLSDGTRNTMLDNYPEPPSNVDGKLQRIEAEV